MGRVIVAMLRIGLKVKVPLRIIANRSGIPGIGLGSFHWVAGHTEQGGRRGKIIRREEESAVR